jgi:hypothetical protein
MMSSVPKSSPVRSKKQLNPRNAESSFFSSLLCGWQRLDIGLRLLLSKTREQRRAPVADLIS